MMQAPPMSPPGQAAPPTMGQPQQPPQQGGQPVTIDAVMALLRDGAMRRFRIDIEVDSTITGDESQERQDRAQFIEATTKFVEAWGPIVNANPMMADLAGELLLFGTRAFRVGRSLEEVIEETVDKLEQQAAQPKPPPPVPPVEQAKIQGMQIKAQAEGQKAQADVQATQLKAQSDQQKAQLDAYHAKLQTENDMQLAREKSAMEKEAMLLDAEIKRRADERAHELHLTKMTHERESHARNLQQGEQQHQHTLQKGEHDAALKKDATSHDMALKEKAAKSEPKDPETKSKLEKLFADISKAVTSKKKIVRDGKGEIVGIEHEKDK